MASVLFSRGGDHHQVTKSGSYIYNGGAADFHEWEFRTRLRVKTAGKDPEKYADVMSRVVDGLRGEAFIIAKEVGLERLWHVGGIEEGVDDSDDIEEKGKVRAKKQARAKTQMRQQSQALTFSLMQPGPAYFH